jgi:transcription initiation factor TFIIB
MVTIDKLVKQGQEVERLKCPNCGSTDIIFDPERGEYVCRHCGLVIQEHVIDLGPEWRAFSSDEGLIYERAKPISPALPFQGIGGSVIEIRYGRNPLLQRRLRALVRLNRFNQYQYAEKRISELRDTIMPLKYKLNIPDSVIEEALIMFRQLASKYDIRGTRTRDLALVLLYIACKRSKLVCPLKELKSALDIEKSKRISKLFNIAKEVIGADGVSAKSQEELGKFLQKVVNALKLGEDVRFQVTRLAMGIINEGQRKRLTNGRTFYALVASAVYIAVTLMGVRKRQRDVAEASRVTDVTIRNRYKEVISKIDIIIEV